ncbi:cohesin subunit SA-1 [Scaptodrosophila lebanonensis]|uniref:Cohesin subunit SA-1 n=1 Tax=Drosophila lebanonensis TaxID=7225 RepID=A0A6J2TN76_DROLE|nr:cohesin subunit SA-1 [Scaptodrosophila lebanonensis]
MLARRGGKRIRMDDPPPYEEGIHSDVLNESTSDGDSPTKRMTRLRARGGVRDKPPIIDDDEDDFFAPVARKRKTPQTRKQPAERKERVERPRKEPVEKSHHQERIDNEREITTDENSLYYIVRHSKNPIANIVDQWIEEYKTNRETALVTLMQFFINASGCKGKISKDIQYPVDHTAIIRRMTEEFDEESGEYPLIMTGTQWKKFKNNFCDFVQTLVKQCQYSIIYDQFLMDNVISLLTGLSDSQVRAFRHTATLAAMKLMTALVDVALLVSNNFDNAAKQFEAECVKSRDRRASDRLDSLNTKRSELEENMDEIKSMLTYMFKSVFVHRYRDALPDIRAICMAEIGIWMENYPQNFLDDSYLKYIGWTLHDKVGEVRLRCLQSLLPLYDQDELKGKLELFTSKFKDRIVAMTLDKEFEVSVHAVKLVISILKIHPEILADKDCEIVYELVYSSHRGVAQAAAEFLNVRLFHLTADMEETKTKRGKVRLPNTPLIRDLVQFFIESELHEHGAYLVDSFIDSNVMMRDWECMTDLLLEEPGPNEEVLDNKQESTLIEIMVSSVKQSATGEVPVGRASNRKFTLSVKEVKAIQDEKAKLTEHFIVTLPALLEKYQADSEKLANLLAVPQYFDLNLYTTNRQEGNLQALLDKISQVMCKHTGRDVLETCAKTLECLCAEGSATYTRCNIARSNIIESAVNKYKDAIDEWRNLIQGEETPNEDDIYNITITLKVLSILYSSHNLNPWELFKSLFQDVEEAQSKENGERCLPNEALAYCIEACYFSISWGLYYVENECETMHISDAVAELRSNLDTFMSACFELTRDGPTVQIQEAAYQSVCDLLIIFSDQLGRSEIEQIRSLEYKSRMDEHLILDNFVQHYVFSLKQVVAQDETRIEELHKKRNFLACYCKLIVYNIIPTMRAATIFKYYVKCYMEYGDIIKATLGKAREINKVNFAMTLLLSLITVFKSLQDQSEDGMVAKNSQEFTDLKELAKRFALTFGFDAIKNRESVAAIHRGGIYFAANKQPDDPVRAPTRLLFLEVLNEFNYKLLKQDKKVIMGFLDKVIPPGMPSSRAEEWQPLVLYRNSLLHGETDQAPVATRRAYTRKRREHDDEEEEEEDEEEHNDPDYRG